LFQGCSTEGKGLFWEYVFVCPPAFSSRTRFEFGPVSSPSPGGGAVSVVACGTERVSVTLRSAPSPVHSHSVALLAQPFGSHRQRRRRIDTLIDRDPRPADVHVGTTAVPPPPPRATWTHRTNSGSTLIPRYDNNNNNNNIIITITTTISYTIGGRRTIGRSAGHLVNHMYRTHTPLYRPLELCRAGIGRNVCVALPLPTGRPAADVRACFLSVSRSRPPCACLLCSSFRAWYALVAKSLPVRRFKYLMVNGTSPNNDLSVRFTSVVSLCRRYREFRNDRSRVRCDCLADGFFEENTQAEIAREFRRNFPWTGFAEAVVTVTREVGER